MGFAGRDDVQPMLMGGWGMSVEFSFLGLFLVRAWKF